MLPKSEADSTVWTTEMAQAFGVCVGLLDAGETVAARMAFRETYTRMVAQARNHGQPVEWFASLGHDPRGRDKVLSDAVAKGRLPFEHAQTLSPSLPQPCDEVLSAITGATKQLR